jgi:hypothetical protein
VGLEELFPAKELERRKAALDAYEAWEAGRPPEPAPEDLFARLDTMRALLPSDLLVPRADGDYEGVRRMHEALAVLGPSR